MKYPTHPNGTAVPFGCVEKTETISKTITANVVLSGIVVCMPEEKPKISYDDFSKLDICIGTVVDAELVPGTDKLIKCSVDFGPKQHPENSDDSQDIRTIVSGIAKWKKPEELVGRQFPYIINLETRIIRGIESGGMILAVGTEDGIALMNPDKNVLPGSRIR
jgi:methionyl-tRNA synthetase